MSDEQTTKNWAAEKFGISPDDVLWYNSGTCYDRIGVKTKRAANKVTKAMQGKSVNGGHFHGMSLGYQSVSGKGKDKHYDVMC